MRLTRHFTEEERKLFEEKEHCELSEKYIQKDNVNRMQIMNKLGQLEDIEDELGIDLIIIGKALLQGDIYVKEVGFVKFHIAGNSICYIGNYGEVVYLNLRDYGKTWALTKEELE